MNDALDGFLERNQELYTQHRHRQKVGEITTRQHVTVTGSYRRIELYDWEKRAEDPLVVDEVNPVHIYTPEDHAFFDSLGQVNPD